MSCVMSHISEDVVKRRTCNFRLMSIIELHSKTSVSGQCTDRTEHTKEKWWSRSSNWEMYRA